MSTNEPKTEFIVSDERVSVAAVDDGYESEQLLEERLMSQLQQLGYERVKIANDAQWLDHLRHKIERLNDYQFSQSEWESFYANCINPLSCANRLSQTCAHLNATNNLATKYFDLRCEDGSMKNIVLIERENWAKNSFEVMHQMRAGKNRLDVTLLINGLPLVHIELKRRGVDIRQAYAQIDRYEREQLALCGLYAYAQIYVISNGTYTRYYSATTRPGKDSWAFTCTWADAANKQYDDLHEFAASFLRPRVIAGVLANYTVFNAAHQLLVMRPYQIAAAERIVARVKEAIASGASGLDAGGYVWHTTGSGKTLTSFKTAQLCAQIPGVQKVLFVVDRKDLDYQTIKEYEKFAKGSALSTRNTAALAAALANESGEQIIVTTIQKLNAFIKTCTDEAIFAKRCVMIFDECHRSQFGKAHEAIVRNFQRYHLFGFTGTPIFAANSANGMVSAQVFGECLHRYTIVNAIADEKVLAFKVNYHAVSAAGSATGVAETRDSAESGNGGALTPPSGGDLAGRPESAAEAGNFAKTADFPKSSAADFAADDENRCMAIAREILAKQRANRGFNSMLACANIPAAKRYYECFKRLQEQAAEHERLKIGVIFSYAPNEERAAVGEIEDEALECGELAATDKEFLARAIADYDAMYASNFKDAAFEDFYKDISRRAACGELDLLIVVGMFLTGFDAPCMNTLYVDKNLAYHGLVQAYSRTNRIFNASKPFGLIECYRDLEEATNEAMKLFGDDASGNGGCCALVREFADFYNGYYDEQGRFVQGYAQVLSELQEAYADLSTSEAQKAFTRAFSKFLRLSRALEAFSEFAAVKKPSEREVQDMQSVYVQLLSQAREAAQRGEAGEYEQMHFEVEFLKTVDIDVGYILRQIEGCEDAAQAREAVMPAVRASVKLAASAQVFEGFIAQLGSKDFGEFVQDFRREKVSECARELALAEGGEEFINASIRAGYVNTNSKDFVDIKPRSVGLFSPQREGDSERIAAQISRTVQTFAPFVGV